MLVPASTHISRLIAARFQLDLLQCPMLLLARTDAESARLIASTVDVADHAFIRGTTRRTRALAEVIARAEEQGLGGEEVGRIESAWLAENELCTFPEGTLIPPQSQIQK